MKAAQTLIKENPEAIYLPFVAKAMLKVLRDHRNIFSDEQIDIATKKYSPDRDRSIEDLKSLWDDFLTKRPHRKSPFSPKDLGRIVKLARKGMDQSTSRKGDLTEEALEKAAKATGIGKETIRKKARYR